NQGLLMSLDQFIEESDPSFLDDFFPGTLNAYIYDGRLYGLPMDSSPLLLMYNRDHLDSAGIAVPADSFEPAEFLRVLERLTQDRDGDQRAEVYGVNNDLADVRDLHFWMTGFGGGLWDEGRTEARLASAESVNAMSFLREMAQ